MNTVDDMEVRVEDMWKSFDRGRIEVLKGVTLHVPKGGIVAIEAAKYSPTLELAFKIARAFGRDVEQVFFYGPPE